VAIVRSLSWSTIPLPRRAGPTGERRGGAAAADGLGRAGLKVREPSAIASSTLPAPARKSTAAHSAATIRNWLAAWMIANTVDPTRGKRKAATALEPEEGEGGDASEGSEDEEVPRFPAQCPRRAPVAPRLYGDCMVVLKAPSRRSRRRAAGPRSACARWLKRAAHL
jgi:hypothetical protein